MWQLRAKPKTVLFGEKPEWRDAVLGGPVKGRFERHMAPFMGADLTRWDAVVPLSLGDQWQVEMRRAEGQRVRAHLVPGPVRELCHDKLGFVRALEAAGLGHRVPAVRQGAEGHWPLILKPRRGAWGEGQVVLHGPDDLAAQAERLADPGWFLQDAVPGTQESATHLLLVGGRVVFQATAVYRMSGPLSIKGAADPGQVVDWVFDLPELPVLLEVLAAVGLADGVCAINHKPGPGGPLVFEINPRFGGSLGGQIGRFLPAYVAALP